MPPRKKPPAAGSAGLTPEEMVSTQAPSEVGDLEVAIRDAGGQVLTCYRDPFGGHWLCLAALPIDAVAPAAFQRELSDAHVKRLTGVIPKVGRFLDPVIAVAAEDGRGFITPNGMHRLDAMKKLGAKSIVALVVLDREIVYRILALNTEKAPNLKDKALEVRRMADLLAAEPETSDRPESSWAFEFEEAAYLTMGYCYMERPRYSGGAYLSMVKKCDGFLELPIDQAGAVRRDRATRLLAVDDAVATCVAALKEKGMQSAYLKPFVVARFNPLRFAKAGSLADFDDTLDRFLAKAEAFDAGAIKPGDLAGAAYAGGGGDDED